MCVCVYARGVCVSVYVFTLCKYLCAPVKSSAVFTHTIMCVCADLSKCVMCACTLFHERRHFSQAPAPKPQRTEKVTEASAPKAAPHRPAGPLSYAAVGLKAPPTPAARTYVCVCVIAYPPVSLRLGVHVPYYACFCPPVLCLITLVNIPSACSRWTHLYLNTPKFVFQPALVRLSS